MRKATRLAFLALALLVGGCQGTTPAYPGPGVPGGTTGVNVAYLGNGQLEVTATDRLAISRVELVGPHGPLPAATSLHREDADPYGPAGQQYAAAPSISPFFGLGFGFGGFRGGSSFGSGIFFGLPPFGYAQAPAPAGAGAGLVRSTARVTLDDPRAYDRQWRNLEVRVRMGDIQVGPVTALPAPDPAAGR